MVENAPAIAVDPALHYQKQVLRVGVLAGEVMLANGAEVARVEQTVNSIVSSFALDGCDSFVTPTGIFISIDNGGDAPPLSLVRRVRSRERNYSIIAAVNDLSRHLVTAPQSPDTVLADLQRIATTRPPYPAWLIFLAGAFSTAAVVLTIGGGVIDAVAALFVGGIVQAVRDRLGASALPTAFGDLFGAAVAAALAIGLRLVGVPLDVQQVIAGGLITLVPGAALVGAVADGLSGQLLSSGARGLEVIFKGGAIAAGTGLVISGFLAAGVAPEVVSSTTARDTSSLQTGAQIAATVVAALFYSVENINPRRTIAAAGLVGGLVWAVYLLMERAAATALVSTVCAAAIAGITCGICARVQRAPALLYILPAVLSLLPGLSIYSGMLALAQGQNAAGGLLLVQAGFIGGAIAIGTGFGLALVQSSAARLPHRRPARRKWPK